jgi:hypothetical protein
MSSTTTYRSVESLPPAVRAEVEAMLAESAPNAKLLPTLAGDLIGQIFEASHVGIITAADAEVFSQRLEGATSLAELGATVAQMPDGATRIFGAKSNVGTAPASGSAGPLDTDGVAMRLPESSSIFITGFSSTPLGGDVVVTPFPDEQMSEAASGTALLEDSLGWQLAVLRARTDVAGGDAKALGLSATEALTRVEPALAAAEAAANSMHPELARRHLAEAAGILDDIDARIEQALTLMETRRYTIAQAARVLEDMGFTVEAGTQGPALVARARNGQRAEVQVGSNSEGQAELVTSVVDPGHAVPTDHAEAGDVCEPAVSTALEFHRTLESIEGLDLGRVTTREFPARGRDDLASESKKPGPAEAHDETVTRVRRSATRNQPRKFAR